MQPLGIQFVMGGTPPCVPVSCCDRGRNGVRPSKLREVSRLLHCQSQIVAGAAFVICLEGIARPR
jgi:hypothetical protein